MINGKKGQTIFYGFMLGITIIVLALALAGPTLSFTQVSMNQTTGLDCTNSSISIYDQGACIVTDLTLPYFVGGLLAIAGIVIGGKIYFDNV